MTDEISSSSAENSKKKPRGKPFAKGADPRRNTKGAPRTFDAYRELVQEELLKIATTQGGQPVLLNGEQVSNLRAIIAAMIHSKNPRERQYILEVAFGKVPDRTELTGADGGAVTVRFVDEATND